MKFAGKTVQEYVGASKLFFAITVVCMAIVVALRLSHRFPPEIQPLFLLLTVMIIGGAGWTAVRKYSFNLKQAGLVGCVLAFGTHWALPIFHSIGEIFSLVFVNTILYGLIAVCGAWLAKKIKVS